ncbi:Dynein heavy chain [Trypanosoma melophagium]|uniref:Dynein heavy chain n=1 Tax=Trypanosoma melophagium TaxID=715481 RepID=UPI00351A3BB4|nr:Dynein heavy chain [Trypanosoma melophagium]
MSLQCENGVALRFEKVISFFLDGIPKPFFRVASDIEYGVTFEFSFFGFSPDYTGQTKLVYLPHFQESEFFDAICLCQCNFSSPSGRIGSHYSPYAGSFRFDGKVAPFRYSESNFKQHTVRIPIETCEQPGIIISQSDKDLRTSLLIDLYEKPAEGFLRLDNESLRRIVILATQGTSPEYKHIIEDVIAEIKRVYVRACCYGIYYYMNKNSLFRQIVSPLCLSESEDSQLSYYKGGISSGEAGFGRVLPYKSSISSLNISLPWSEKTHHFFTGLQELWVNRFDRLVVFDTTTTSWKTDANVFLAQLLCSMRAAFTRIRIEFYTQLECILFDRIRGSKKFLSLNIETLKENDLKRIFLATRVFLVNKIRSLILEAVEDLVKFFMVNGEHIISPAKARKIPVLEVSLTVGGTGLPCSPSFAQLRFGIADLLDELLDSANSLPTPEAVIMRTLDFERQSLNSFDASELSMKTVLIGCLDAAGSVIEDLRTRYAGFSTLPAISGTCFTRAKETTIESQIRLLHDGVESIAKVSPDIVYCGCIAINCIEVKKWYIEQWSRYIENYLTSIRKDLFSYLTTSVKKCRCNNERLKKEPQTVKELEELIHAIKDTDSLSKEVEMNDCKRVIKWFNCLENLRIPIDTQLYATAMELMRCPNELRILVSKGEEICIKSKPFLEEKLSEFRNSTRNQVKTIHDGVDELLSFFNLDVSDIAAQTCEELRVIVNQVLEAIEYISYCEKCLEIEEVDSFNDFFPLLNEFEVLEQFWGSVFDSTAVRDYYKNPVNNLDAPKMIENVQQCRRLLHSSTRNLRAYPGLVRLGRQQEQVLSEFESLEGVLLCITTPGLRKNHWKEIARLLNLQSNENTSIDSSITLQFLLEAGLQNHLDELKRVVDPALIDFNTETSLERMKSEAKKTRFVFEPLEGTKDVFVLSPLCRDSIYSKLEYFLTELRVLRQHVSLSQYVVNSINEWEAAVEKMRGILLNWKELEEDWIENLRFGITLESIDEGETPAMGSREWKFLHEKVGSLSGIFTVLSTTLQKPQYTLFTAMMQENIQEQLSLACTILSDMRKAITGLFEAKREAFPRFYFLSDTEMNSFLSVLNTTTLTRLLSKMYDRVCDIRIEGNAVTAFLTADGAILKAENSISLSPVPIERWMNTFEKTLRSSFFHELETTIESHYHLDPMTWLRGSCVQFIDVALRVIHNRDLREAISISGGLGINAYLKRLKDIAEEYVRLINGDLEHGERHIISSAITIILYFKQEVQLIIKSGIQTLSELDKTAMVETLIENDKIIVQSLGFRLPYGMEFLGNYSVPLLTPEYVKNGLYSVFITLAASSFPLFVDESNKTCTLEYFAQYLGRFWWCLQCNSSFTLDGVARGVRGALSVGAVFCLKDVELLDMNLVVPLTKLIKTIEEVCQSEKEISEEDVRINFESNGVSINVRRNPCFQVAFTTHTLDEIPTSLSLAFRPIYLLPMDLTVLAQGTLQALGFSRWMTVGKKLAIVYLQFMELSPIIFTIKRFIPVMQDVGDCQTGRLEEHLCMSFLRQFLEVIQINNKFKKLLEWNMIQTFNISQDFWDDALEQVMAESSFDILLRRFTNFMTFNLNVILVGPAYSGKMRLWKEWNGDTHHIVLPFRLISSAEIYGNASQPGLLSSLAKKWDPIVKHTIIIENANLLNPSIVFDTSAFVRIRSYSGPDYVKGPNTRLITVTPFLDSANPRIVTDFAVFALPESSGWKSFLKEILQTTPNYYASIAYSAISILMDSILDARLAYNSLTIPYENRFAVASRCSKFYKRWYVYALSQCGNREEWLSEQAFALQCAVFATCWTLGLRLQGEERMILRTSLEKVQTKLNRVAKDIGFTEDVLPPMENDLLFYIATPAGWRKFGSAAAEAGFPTLWAQEVSDLNINNRAWSQFFSFPSRKMTLTFLEYLVNAGQPILLVGNKDQGKTTILHHIQSNKQWAHQMVYNNEECKVVEVQESLFQNMSLRQSKIYGPSVGQKLVLCVDDVHLPVEAKFSQFMTLFSFIDRFSAMCLPSFGYVPVTDLICVGVTTPISSYETNEENAVIRLGLPDLEDSELIDGVQNLFELICSTRRAANILKEVPLFLASAQSAVLRLMSRGKEKKDVDREVQDDENEKEVINKNSRDNHLLGVEKSGELHLSYKDLYLKVSDRSIRFLSSSLDDTTALKNIYISVQELYVAIINTDEDKLKQWRKELKETADVTLKNCLNSDSFSFDNVHDETPLEVYDINELPPCTTTKVQDWIRLYDTLVASSGVEDPFLRNYTLSIIVAPLNGQKRKSRITTAAETATSALTRRKTVGTVTGTETTGVATTPRLAKTVYAFNWMTRLIYTLHQCLRQQQTHVALIGPYNTGIDRALSVWGNGVQCFVAFLRDNYTDVNARENFKSDLVEILQCACRNDSRTVLFVPNTLLNLRWPMACLDAIIRGGNVDNLFTFEEQVVLLHGRRAIRRGSARLTLPEQNELRQRICTRLSTVIHVLNYEELKRLERELPLFATVLPIELHTSNMVKELMNVLFQSEEENKSVVYADTDKLSEKNSSEFDISPYPMDFFGRPFPNILCDIFDAMKVHVNIHIEHLVEFGFQAQRLRYYWRKVRRHAAQSQHVTDLPNIIADKKKKYETSLNNAKTERESILKNVEFLNICATKEEKRSLRYQKIADRLREEAKGIEELIVKEEENVQSMTGHAAAMLNTAASRLISTKISQIKQFGATPPLPKGTLFVKALCKILGEELHIGTPKETWEFGKSIITAPKFIVRLVAVSPSNFTYETLSPFHSSLREVRYGELSPLANLILEYITALMEATRVGEEAREKQIRLNKLRLKYSNIRSKVELAQERADKAQKKMNDAHSEVTCLKQRCGYLDATIEDINRRQAGIVQLLDLVDRFNPFHSLDGTKTSELGYEKGEGIVIIIAAQHALFGMLSEEDQRKCLRQLQLLLGSWGITTPIDLNDPVLFSLFPSISEILDITLVERFFQQGRLCLGGLLGRVYFHWPFFGGVTPVFERLIKNCLKFMCGDCMVVSALDNNIADSVLEAAKDGTGLLICDASVSFMLEKFYILLQLCSKLREAMIHKKPVQCSLFGKNIEVKPSFYLIGVSSAIVPCNDVDYAASRFIAVTNFYTTQDVNNRMHAAFLLSPGSNNNTELNDIFGMSKVHTTALRTFRNNLYDVYEMFCREIDQLAGNRGGELEQLDILIGDLNTQQTAVLQLSAQRQNMFRVVEKSWRSFLQALGSVEKAIRVIEMKILGRNWDARRLEPLITSATTLSRAFQWRISPSTLEALPDLHREFFVTVNFIERTIQFLACGWPHELRGTFAWYVLSSVVNDCEIFFNLRGELYSASTLLHNHEQYVVLDSLLNRNGNIIDKEYIYKLYSASSDSLLNSITRRDSASEADAMDTRGFLEGEIGGGAEGLLRSFFINWMSLNYTKCELIASHFYDAFMFAVKEQNHEGEDEVMMIYDYVGNTPATVYSIEECITIGLKSCVPFYVPSGNIYSAIKYLKRLTNIDKLSYRFCRMSSIKEIDEVMEKMAESFCTRPVNQGRGHCIIAMVIPPINPSEEEVFTQHLARQISRCCSYGVWGHIRNGNQSRSSVILCCAMKSSSRNKHKNCIHMLQRWCLTLIPETSFPRIHLFSLLEDDTVYLPWKREGMSLKLDGVTNIFYTGERKSSISRKQSLRTLSTATLSNVIESYVGLLGGESILRALWETDGFDDVLSDIYQTAVDYDDLTLILRLLAMLLRSDRNKGGLPQLTHNRNRSHRLSIQMGQRMSVADVVDNFSLLRQQSDRVGGLYTKIAYGIYSARMSTIRYQLPFSEVLRHRSFSNVTDDTLPMSCNATIDEAIRAGLSGAALSTELRQSNDDFLGLCTDEGVVEAYRERLHTFLHNLLYGNPLLKEALKAREGNVAEDPASKNTLNLSLSDPSGVDAADNTPTKDDASIVFSPIGETIELIFLWEIEHYRDKVTALNKAGHTALSSRLRDTMTQLACWIPGEPLTVWLPALQHPKLFLYTFLAQAINRKVDPFSRVEMILVMLRRCNLLHDDIILSGAALSISLENEILSRTNWKKPDLPWRKELHSVENEDDVVIAIRFQKMPENDNAGELNDLLWEVRTNERWPTPYKAAGTSKPSIIFLTDMSDKLLPNVLEMQPSCALPVLCAKPETTLQSETPEWRFLFELPFCAVLMGDSDLRSRRTSSLLGRQSVIGDGASALMDSIKAAGETPVSLLNDSSGYFVTLS